MESSATFSNAVYQHDGLESLFHCILMARVLLGDAADTSRIFRYFPRLKSHIHGYAVQKVTLEKENDHHGFLDAWVGLVGRWNGIHAM